MSNTYQNTSHAVHKDSPAPQVFERVSHELGTLYKYTESLQDDLSHLIAALPQENMTYIHGLQSLDLMSQTVADLVSMFNALAVLTPSDQMLQLESATQNLKLHDLMHRLNTGEGPPENTHDPTSPGRQELF